MALPLGELSPQVTERALLPVLNGNVNVCKSSPGIYEEKDTRACAHGASFPCEAAWQFPVGCYLLVWSYVALSVLAVLGHLSQRERQGPLSRLRRQLSQRESQVPLSRLRRQLSQRESQVPRPTHYTERCIEARPYCLSNWTLNKSIMLLFHLFYKSNLPFFIIIAHCSIK